MGSSVDGIYGGDGVEPDSGILGIVDGPKKMVFLRITVTKYTDRQRWPSSGKRTFISPTSNTVMHQHSHRLHATLLHVSLVHKVSSEFHCVRSLVFGGKSRGTAAKIGTCD